MNLNVSCIEITGDARGQSKCAQKPTSRQVLIARASLAILLACPAISVFAGAEVCFPRFRDTGAIPGTKSCQLTASTASIGLGSFYCTAGISYIEEYCGTIPKDLGHCESTPHPIGIGTANKSLVEEDLRGIDGFLQLKRYYNSSAAAGPGEMFGDVWRSNFEAKVVEGGARASVYRPDGRIIFFTFRRGSLVPDDDISDTLVAQTEPYKGWRYTDSTAGWTEEYDAAGRLQAITRRDGRRLTLGYSTADTPSTTAPGAGYLIAVTDPFGRSLRYSYDESKKLRAVVDPAGNAFGFKYDDSGNLAAVSFPDGHQRLYAYNESSHTGGNSLPGALTGISDDSRGRLATYVYAGGRAVSEHLTGQAGAPVEAYSIAYDRFVGFDESTEETFQIGQSTVTDPLGSQRVYSFAQVLGVTRGTGVSQPGGSGCAAASSQIAYDARGNVARRDDFNQHRTCMAHDDKNRESARVEGLDSKANCAELLAGAPIREGSRKVSTEWHPDWRLRVRVAEPGRLTTSVYNGQPDPFAGGAIASCAPHSAVLPDGKPIAVLCREVEQATSDADGHQGLAAKVKGDRPARERHWTYNENGQVLIATDPLGRATQHAYYGNSGAAATRGDLQSVTNPAGHVTTFDQYDPLGQVLQRTDPNGLVTNLFYDPRQRLSSTTVGGQTTRFAYNADGLLTSTSLPDGSSITQTYDPANRLTRVVDAAGNKLVYTLDAAGNRIGEQLQDPSGAVLNQITRSFDALGKLESVTGASE